MSIPDLPLVVEYHDAINNALKLQQSASNNDETNTAIETIRAIRTQESSQKDSSAHDAAIDNAVREKYIGLVAHLDIHESEYEQVWNLIDLVNNLSDNGLVEPGLGFYLIEELLESQTISGCRKVFDYLESRRSRMVRKNFTNKSLVILRCCNELLRRLSRAEETVFCGRVFIYLFQTFPLGDRSSVNLRGVFHIENVTTYDASLHQTDDGLKPMEIDNDLSRQVISRAQTPASTVLESDQKTSRSTPSIKGTKLDQKDDPPPDLNALYPVFWSLQSIFSDPTRLFEPQAMQQFKDGLSTTMSCFRYVAKASTPSTESIDLKRGVKRKHEETNGSNVSTLSSTFNPKYLTSRDLFDLEIHDIAFRRHILVQELILIDFLLSLNPATKAKTTGLTNKSVLYTYNFSEEDTKWAQNTRSNIATYLQQTGIGIEGSLYYRMVETVLSRDKNWARWKAENCPPISRLPLEVKSYVEAEKSLQQLSAIKSMPIPPGADELAFLNHNEPLESLKHPSKKHRAPTLSEYYKGIQGDDLDLDFATNDEEKAEIEEKKAGKLWRALRAANGRKFALCDEIKNGENLKALIGEGIDNKTNGDNEIVDQGEQEDKAQEAAVDEIAKDGIQELKSEIEMDVEMENQPATEMEKEETVDVANSASKPDPEFTPMEAAQVEPDGDEATN